MRRRRLRRRLFWIGVVSALMLLALTGYVLSAVSTIASAARRATRPSAVPTHEGRT
jgi:hypothetical protein